MSRMCAPSLGTYFPSELVNRAALDERDGHATETLDFVLVGKKVDFDLSGDVVLALACELRFEGHQQCRAG